MEDDKHIIVASTREERLKGKILIVILEEACLELMEGRHKQLELLNNSDHRPILRRLDRPHEDVRPDITHHCLLALLGSPLNKAGKLLLYIHTSANELIEVSPQLIIPKTWKQFSALMISFLQKNRLKAADRNVVLMRLIKNRLTSILPAGSRRIGLSVSGETVALRSFVEQFKSSEQPVVLAIGAVAHGDPTPKCDYLERNISIAPYGLTAATCCAKVCAEFERVWGIF
eukprot:GHVT01048681.1.p1 GENE.GHVT01048681.1~~GHVT01048681.1.p1  ORF type:complete len:230 (-),score=34.71 GHVT01048681.1:1054-1743(-)